MGLINLLEKATNGTKIRGIESTIKQTKNQLIPVTMENIRNASNIRFKGLRDHFMFESYDVVKWIYLQKVIDKSGKLFVANLLRHAGDSSQDGAAFRLRYELNTFGIGGIGIVHDKDNMKIYNAICVRSEELPEPFHVIGFDPILNNIVYEDTPGFNGRDGFIIW